MSLLTARHYAYRVERKQLLEDINLSVSLGERVAIIGPNGAGKSTLLKSLMGLLPHGEGELLLQSRNLKTYTQKERACWLSYVPQYLSHLDLFTVREFMLMGRFPHLSAFSRVTAMDQEAVRRALKLIAMTEYAHRPMATLSGGEQQKVLIGAALVQEARIMLLDEPATFLDPREQDNLYQLLHQLHRRLGLTFLEVTHDLNRALAHDRVVALKQGRLVFDGTPQGLVQKGVLAGIYQKPFEFFNHPRTGQPLVLPGGWVDHEV
jgi:iron complex transport system ATP-binding protein